MCVINNTLKSEPQFDLICALNNKTPSLRILSHNRLLTALNHSFTPSCHWHLTLFNLKPGGRWSDRWRVFPPSLSFSRHITCSDMSLSRLHRHGRNSSCEGGRWQMRVNSFIRLWWISNHPRCNATDWRLWTDWGINRLHLCSATYLFFHYFGALMCSLTRQPAIQWHSNLRLIDPLIHSWAGKKKPKLHSVTYWSEQTENEPIS